MLGHQEVSTDRQLFLLSWEPPSILLVQTITSESSRIVEVKIEEVRDQTNNSSNKRRRRKALYKAVV
jgi:hypothetical protein